MHSKFTPTRPALSICTLCSRPVTRRDCWRANRESAARVHVLCLAATFVIDDSPSRLDYEVVADVNDNADAICAEWCENPRHQGRG